MEYKIIIENDELTELQKIISDIKKEQPLLKMDERQYVENIIKGHLQARVKNRYVSYVQSKSIEQLKASLGSI